MEAFKLSSSDRKEWSTAKKALFIIIICCIGLIIISMISGWIFPDKNTENIKPITTPYNTTCKLDIGGGFDGNKTSVTEEGQVIVFDNGYYDGYFISTSKDKVFDLINLIENTGTKCRQDDVVWYHMEDKELTNGWSPMAWEHLKLKTTAEYDVGFVENPNSDEIIILMASPDRIIDCFNSIKWG